MCVIIVNYSVNTCVSIFFNDKNIVIADYLHKESKKGNFDESGNQFFNQPRSESIIRCVGILTFFCVKLRSE